MKLPQIGHCVFPSTAKLGVLFLCVVFGTAAMAQTSSTSQATEIEQLTNALVGTAQAANSPPKVRSMAQKRHDLLLKLAATAPQDAFRFMLPADVATNLPNQLRDLVETDADEQGTLEVRVEDYPDHSHKTLFFLDTARERLQLYFAKDKPHLLTGTRVRAWGKRLDGILLLQSGSTSASTTSSGLQTQALASPNTFGAQSSVVILVNFQDNTAQPYTVETARTLVFTNVSNFDMENSQNQTWLTGDVFGWFTLAMSGSTCNSDQLATLANQAATAAGVNLSSYRRIVYSFPQNACGWAGLGTVGGNPSRAWINGSFNLLVVGHEMGHNFGLYHAHSLICPGTTLGTSCSTGEYGDVFDIMGNYTASHFDAFHKEQIGWLNYGSSLPITTVASSGTYTIPPYETGSGSKALKIAKDASTFYYVEYRQPVGFDSVLSSYPASTSGVLLRTGAPSDANSSFLLDTNPGTSSFSDAALAVGKTFTDPAAGVSITLTSASASGATVNVTLGTSSCAHNNPGVAINPAQASGAAGATVAYTVSVTNNDGTACSSGNFSLAATVPVGWSAVFTIPTLTLAPGASGSATLNVTSAAGAANGVNTVIASATNVAATAFKGSASATYTVNTPTPANFSLSASPASVSIAPGSSGTTKITSTISGSFNSAVALSASGMPSGVSSTFSPASIAAPGSGVSTLTFTASSSAAAGTYPITVAGSGGGLTRTTAISMTVNNDAGPMGLRFVPLTPCRIADTRPWNGTGPFAGPSIAAQGSRSFPLPQSTCHVPSTARAYSLNITVVPMTNFLGFITVWPSDQPRPWVSMLNSTDGRVKASAAIVPGASNGGAISVFATDATDVILDINGYFVDSTAPSFAQALAFFPLPPCRVVDTRYAGGSLGPPSMVAWQERSFAILTSSCNIPTTAQAYSLNFTAVPKGNIGFLATWPTGPGVMPNASTLNVSTGAVTANAAIVPAGASGAISVMATGDTDLVIDTNGYFAPPTLPSSLSFHTVPPCRVRDTRENTGLFSTAPLPIDTSASQCGIPASAQAIVLNATVVPTPPGLGFLTLWPHGGMVPNVSTLNASDGFITVNMAIVPTANGVIDAYASEPTQLLLDTTGYFAP